MYIAIATNFVFFICVWTIKREAWYGEPFIQTALCTPPYLMQINSKLVFQKKKKKNKKASFF